MRFEWPLMLLGLLAIPAVVAGYWFVQRRRSRYAVTFTNLEVLASVAGTIPRRRHLIPAILALLALTAALAALARPSMPMSVGREQASIVLTVDISGSMRATDVKPTRLGAAQEAIRHFLNKLPGQYRVGLVTFSTEAYVASPLTRDRKLVLAAVDSMYTGRGTALGDGLARSVELVQTAPNPEDAPAPAQAPTETADPDHPLSAILLLSDGAQTTGLLEPRDAAERAKSYGIPVFTIALGTPDGYVDGGGGGFGGGFGGGGGGGGFRRPVPPDPATLAKIAEITGGEAFETTSDARLNQVYEDMASRFGKKTEWREATSLFLGAAALLAIAGGLLSMLWGQRLP
jgi:Ca-activated chloride channel family protein